MMDQNTQTRPIASRCPFQHGEIPVRVAPGQNGTFADGPFDVDWLAFLVVDKGNPRGLDDHRSIPRRVIDSLSVGAQDLIRGDTIGLFCKDAHEMQPTARDDIGCELFIAQIAQQFDHRLIGHLVVRQIGVAMTRSVQPRGDGGLKFFDAIAGMGGVDHLDQSVMPAFKNGLEITFGSCFQGRGRENAGILFSQFSQPIHREDELKIYRLFCPKRAVIVEDGNPICRGHIVRPFRISDRANKFDDCLFRTRRIPTG